MYQKSLPGQPKLTFQAQKRALNKKYKTIVGGPYPFLKWVGGKRQLLKQFDAHFPKEFNTYIEPFVGGGTVFFYLLPENAVLADINAELMNCYTVIQTQVETLIQALQTHRNEAPYFYQVRRLDRDKEKFSTLTQVERASRTIYLNKCCYNGLYRVNSHGYFNAPFGKHKNPQFCDEDNLRQVSQFLKNVRLLTTSFENCLALAKDGDFVYLDPPYQPISATADFTSYTTDGFGEQAQVKLYALFKQLDRRGCKLLLSNSHSPLILDLYREFHIVTVQAKRIINTDITKRGEVNEVLISNL